MESRNFNISSEMHFHRTRYQDKSSCDSRLHVPSLRGVFYRPSEFPGFRSLTEKFVGDRRAEI